MQFIVVLGQ